MTLVDEPGTTPAAPALPVEQRIRITRVDGRDALALVLSGVASFCLTWLVFERLTPLSGGLGFFVCWYVAFLVVVALVLRDQHGPVAAKDKLASVVITSGGALLITSLVLIVGYTTFRGISALRPTFFTETLRTTGPLDPAEQGGGAHAIVGTVQQVGLAVVLTVPLGVATALFLNEIGGRLARPVRLIVDAMTAVPSIVAGLFIYAVLILGLGYTFSGFPASLALSVLMLPTVTRTAEVVLRLVPGGLREGALALGGTEWRMARLVVLPTARTGLVTAVILGIARAVGETAPLLLTSGTNAGFNWNPFDGQQESLPVFVFNQIRSSSEESVARAWTGAFVLLVLVLVLFVTARVLGGRSPGARRRRWLRRTPEEVSP